MKYYKLVKSSQINGITRNGISGEHVKGKEEFFKVKKSGPDQFYDKDYEFNYLVPKAFGDPEPEADLICDFHSWHGEAPRNGLFDVVSDKLKVLLEEHNLISSKFYNAVVKFQEKDHKYFVWQYYSNEYQKYIDFEHTIFANLDWYFKPVGELEEKNFSTIKEVKEYCKDNWGFQWNYKRLVMKPEFRKLDFCSIYNLNLVVSDRLKKAIEEGGILGLEFEELPIKIEFSDEI